MSSPVIGYAGMTHLGLCSGIAAASKGFAVVGYHNDAELIAAIEGCELPVMREKATFSPSRS